MWYEWVIKRKSDGKELGRVRSRENESESYVIAQWITWTSGDWGIRISNFTAERVKEIVY